MDVVPEFTSVFDETGQALPLPTILLIAISSFLGRFWWLVIPAAPFMLKALRLTRACGISGSSTGYMFAFLEPRLRGDKV